MACKCWRLTLYMVRERVVWWEERGRIVRRARKLALANGSEIFARTEETFHSCSGIFIAHNRSSLPSRRHRATAECALAESCHDRSNVVNHIAKALNKLIEVLPLAGEDAAVCERQRDQSSA